MTGWSTLTFLLDADEYVYDKPMFPTGLSMDSGADERGWISEQVGYALSFGRYQDKRFRAFAHDIHCPKFSGISKLMIAETNNTDDVINLTVYEPLQHYYNERADGYITSEIEKGKRWPDEEREEFLTEIEDEYGFAPVIEPRETTTPPDMLVWKRE